MPDWVTAPVAISISVLITVAILIFKIGSWRGEVNTDRSSFKGYIKETKQILETIQNDIKSIFLKLPPVPVSGSSPRQLTDFGEKIAEQFGADEWASTLAPDLMRKVEQKKPFEIDQFCQNYVESELTSEYEVRVLECAYEKGTSKENVLAVLAVVLRDKLLDKTQDR